MARRCKLTLVNGTVKFGQISQVDEDGTYILFLEQEQVGMLGRDGTRYQLEEIASIFEENPSYPGTFEGENYLDKIRRWRRSWSKR